MKHFTLLIFAVSVALAACAPETAKLPNKAKLRLYTGLNSSEAILEFDYFVQTTTRRQPTETQAHDLIEAQLTHLFGTMDASTVPAVPKANHRISRIRIEPSAEGYVARYHYSGTIVVADESSNTYSVVLPRNPETIYKQSIAKIQGRLTYPCTDSHYNSEDDFWYFWNPDQPGCRLTEGKHFDRIEAKVKRLPNTAKTYPEYERMMDSNGTIRIAIFFGMDEEKNIKNPLKSDDVNSENFRALRQSLVNLGYSAKPMTRNEITQFLGFTPSPFPYLETFTKKNSKATIVIKMFFGPTGIDENSSAFHYFYKDALEKASVMIYDGHSGLGGHLDLTSIEEAEQFSIKPNPSKYQLYYFNSCTSYTYYNTEYFERKQTQADKRGTKNLDILANGLATFFDVMHDTNMALLRAIDTWSSGKAKTSYQELAATIDSENLFGVIGDEDNPTR